MVCPIEGCTYSGKVWLSKSYKSEKEKYRMCNESNHCPIHRTELVYHRAIKNHPLNDMK